ncbi:MAG: sulfatase-like hydrolase/transferase [Kiritimatiellia bacterium]
MKRRDFMKLLGSGIALSAFPLAAQTSVRKSQRQPNIVFFLVDDMGWQDTSLPFWYPNNGNSPKATVLNARYHTPHMERMAREGMIFTAAYAQPVCSPTRCSVMSGMNAARHRVTNWTAEVDGAPSNNGGPVNGVASPVWAINGLQPPGTLPKGTVKGAYNVPDRAYPATQDVPYYMSKPYTCAQTLPMFLKMAGYSTVMAGKAHFASGNGFAPSSMVSPGQNPRLMGFDVNLCGSHKGQPSNYRADKGMRYGGEVFGLEKEQAAGHMLTNALTRQAIAAIETLQSQKPERPFFLYLGHFALHLPCDNGHAFDSSRATDPDILKDSENANPQDGLAWNAIERNYGNLISGMDESLGHILDWAADQKARTGRDTLVVFMADNGGLVGQQQRSAMDSFKGNAPLKYGKGSCYEGGIREPFIAWMPGVLKAGEVNHTPIICEDLFPTFLDYAGVAPETIASHLASTPSTVWKEGAVAQVLDGVSLRSTFEGKRTLSIDRPILIHSPNAWLRTADRAYDFFTTLRVGDWKLIWHQDLGVLELYNVVSDISELNDLSKTFPARTRKLAKQMANLLRERGAQRPTRQGQCVPWPDEL